MAIGMQKWLLFTRAIRKTGMTAALAQPSRFRSLSLFAFLCSLARRIDLIIGRKRDCHVFLLITVC